MKHDFRFEIEISTGSQTKNISKLNHLFNLLLILASLILRDAKNLLIMSDYGSHFVLKFISGTS